MRGRGWLAPCGRCWDAGRDLVPAGATRLADIESPDHRQSQVRTLARPPPDQLLCVGPATLLLIYVNRIVTNTGCRHASANVASAGHLSRRVCIGYPQSMHAERVTVSLPPEVAAAARQAVEAGTASSVSAYVAGAVQERLVRERGLAELATLFAGPPPAEALDAVRRDFGLPPRTDATSAKAS